MAAMPTVDATVRSVCVEWGIKVSNVIRVLDSCNKARGFRVASDGN